MNTYAVVFAAIVVVVSGASVKNPPGSGWGVPAPSVVLDLSADAQAIGEGSADATQDLSILAQGTYANPADIVMTAGTGAVVAQNIDLLQVANANADGSTSTLNAASVQNQAAGQDNLQAIATGGQAVTVANAGATNSAGSGAIAENASTLNQVNQ